MTSYYYRTLKVHSSIFILIIFIRQRNWLMLPWLRLFIPCTLDPVPPSVICELTLSLKTLHPTACREDTREHEEVSLCVCFISLQEFKPSSLHTFQTCKSTTATTTKSTGISLTNNIQYSLFTVWYFFVDKSTLDLLQDRCISKWADASLCICIPFFLNSLSLWHLNKECVRLDTVVKHWWLCNISYCV